ncbi:hypothetical protein [Aeromicrobium chenweiae]|nr:hypothetical protein [Aeromicrobium chenweiae]
MRIPGRTTSRLMSGLAGREVVLIEGLEVSPGAQFKITFISWSDKRRQGIWFGTEGLLEFPDTGLTSPQMTLWTDTAPAEFQIDVLETDGLLRFYNIWDEGEGRGSESLVDYSGMVVDHDGGVATYRCQDFGREPHFSSLAFTMESLR